MNRILINAVKSGIDDEFPFNNLKKFAAIFRFQSKIATVFDDFPISIFDVHNIQLYWVSRDV